MKNKLRRRGATSTESSLTLQQLGLMLGIFTILSVSLEATQPAWWTATGGPLNSNPPNDYAVANQGQLKQFTQKAAAYLNANLTNGAGATLNSMVTGWSNYYQTNGYTSTNPAPADLKVVNQGQLKYIASLVYPQLSTAGYMSTNVPTWLQTNASDFKAANLGELKQIFAFQISAPQTPINLVVQFGSTSATLTWSDPVVSVQSFTVQYSTNGGSSWTTAATVAGNVFTATMTGLTLGSNYSFRVTASNGAGSSAPSTGDAAPIITLYTPLDATLVP